MSSGVGLLKKRMLELKKEFKQVERKCDTKPIYCMCDMVFIKHGGFRQGWEECEEVFLVAIKDWFQLLKDNNQYDDFVKYYGDLWEEVFGKVKEK